MPVISIVFSFAAGDKEKFLEVMYKACDNEDSYDESTDTTVTCFDTDGMWSQIEKMFNDPEAPPFWYILHDYNTETQSEIGAHINGKSTWSYALVNEDPVPIIRYVEDGPDARDMSRAKYFTQLKREIDLYIRMREG